MAFEMPRDAKGRTVQAHTPDSVGVSILTIAGSSHNVAVASGAEIVRIYVSAACWYTVGNSGVVVSSNTGAYLPANAIEEPIKVLGFTYISAIRDSADGFANIVKLT